MKSYRTPPDVAVNHDHSIDSKQPSLPEQRPIPTCRRCGRSFVFSFCNDEDDVFCVVEGLIGKCLPGKFQKEQQRNK